MLPDQERRIQDRAGRQHGIVTRRQLIEAGLSSAAVGRLLKAGRLRAVHRGVYLLGPMKPDRATEMAAVLAGGPSAVLSHTSAASLWGYGPDHPARSTDRERTNGLHRSGEHRSSTTLPGPIHIIVPGSGRGQRPGIIVHRIMKLASDEHTLVDGIPVTSPSRTLVDLAGLLGSREVERAVAAAEREGLITSEELAQLPERYRRHAGIGVLRSLILEQSAPEFTRSEAERRCLDLLRTAELPVPHTNVPVGPYELDLFWPDAGVAVEVDGRAYHSSRRRFEGDRRKDAWLRARGITVVRLTWRQITRRPIATAVEVGQILARAETRRSTT